MTLSGNCHEVHVATFSRHCIAVAISKMFLLTSAPPCVVCVIIYQLLGHCTCHLIVELFICRSFWSSVSLAYGMHPIVQSPCLMYPPPAQCLMRCAQAASHIAFCTAMAPLSPTLYWWSMRMGSLLKVGKHMWCRDSFSESTSHVNLSQSDFSAIMTISYNKWDDQLLHCSFMMWRALYSGMCMTLKLSSARFLSNLTCSH